MVKGGGDRPISCEAGVGRSTTSAATLYQMRARKLGVRAGVASSPQAVRQLGESSGLQGIALVLMLILLESRRAAFMNDERSEEVINIVGHYVY